MHRVSGRKQGTSCRSPARYSLGRCTIGASLPIIGYGGCGVTGDSMCSFGSRLLRQKKRRTSKSLAGVKPGRPRRCILLQWPCAAAQKHISFSAAQAQATFPSSMRALAKPEIAAVWPWASVVGRCRRGRRRPSLRLGDKRANARRDGLRVARHPRLLKVLGSSSLVSSACHARLARAHAGRRVVRFGVEQENTKPNRMATDGITHRLHAQPWDASLHGVAWYGVGDAGRHWSVACGCSRGSTPSCRCTTMTR